MHINGALSPHKTIGHASLLSGKALQTTANSKKAIKLERLWANMLHIRECLVEIKDKNLDTEKRTCFSEGHVCETKHTTTAALFLALQKEYGKCVSKQYRDVTVDGKPVVKQIGWVFEKRVSYEDSWLIKKGQPKTFLQETWIEVFSEAPVTTITYTHPW